jgi:poly(3-hydroxybutyrate) depolymerase
MMLYQFYEMQHAAMAPFRLAAKAGAEFWLNTPHPLAQSLAQSHFGKQAKASLDMFERMTRRFGKPGFGIDHTIIKDDLVAIDEHVVWQDAFCRLVHFRKTEAATGDEVPILIVAPMSGHHATLLRHTVECMLPGHDVFITDWIDAREVPLAAGSFDLDDYTDYVISMLHHLGRRAHVMAVCQPSVPVLAAVALMSERNDVLVPLSMVLMGGPVDTRQSPTGVNKLAQNKGEKWFRHNVILEVPHPNPGAGRKVYPGFLQLAGFLSMNPKRHITAHQELYWNLIDGDTHSAQKQQEFYDEYMSVMDLTAEFYLQTVDRVFLHQSLPHGTYRYRGTLIDPSRIQNTSLLTVEGERDDISGIGQTKAAHALCSGLSETRKAHHLQMGVGHYGVFSGRRFQQEVVPVITDFFNRAETPT